MSYLRNAAAATLAAALIPVLGACADKADAPAQEATPAAAAAGLTVSNARVVLPPVVGNPAAVYFDLAWAGASGVTLDAVEVEGAGMTMIHDYATTDGKMKMVMVDSVSLTPGTPVTFAPGGLHVMALEPAGVPSPGGAAKITLTLSDGTVTTIDAPVRAAGDER